MLALFICYHIKFMPQFTLFRLSIPKELTLESPEVKQNLNPYLAKASCDKELIFADKRELMRQIATWGQGKERGANRQLLAIVEFDWVKHAHGPMQIHSIQEFSIHSDYTHHFANPIFVNLTPLDNPSQAGVALINAKQVDQVREQQTQSAQLQLAKAQDLNDSQSVHTASIEEAAQEAISILKKSYPQLQNDKAINECRKSLASFAKKLSTSNKEFRHLNKHTLNAAKKFIQKTYPKMAKVNKLVETALTLVWTAINDDAMLKKAALKLNPHHPRPNDFFIQFKNGVREKFIRCLYEIERGNNLDSNGKDNLSLINDSICENGAINDLLYMLNGIHPQINMIFTNEDTITLQMINLIDMQLKEYIKTAENKAEIIQKLKQEKSGNDFVIHDDVWEAIKGPVEEQLKKEYEHVTVATFGKQSKKGNVIIKELLETSGPYRPITAKFLEELKTIAYPPAGSGKEEIEDDEILEPGLAENQARLRSLKTAIEANVFTSVKLQTVKNGLAQSMTAQQIRQQNPRGYDSNANKYNTLIEIRDAFSGAPKSNEEYHQIQKNLADLFAKLKLYSQENVWFSLFRTSRVEASLNKVLKNYPEFIQSSNHRPHVRRI